MWVRGDSACHSACVLLLAAGDMRVIAGPVGIHRMIRLRSSATSRKELGEELRTVSDEMRNYLERNGASDKVYDLMTTVPNRTLRLLTVEAVSYTHLDVYKRQRQSHGMLWYARCSRAWARSAASTASRNCSHNGIARMAFFTVSDATSASTVLVDAVAAISTNWTSTWPMKK